MPGRLRDVLPHGVMLIAAGLLYWAAMDIDAPTGGRIGPAAWPKAIIVIMALLCAYEVVKRLLVGSGSAARGLVSTAPAGEPPEPGEAEPEPARHPGMLFGGIAIIAGYVVVVPWTGFFVTTALFLAIFPWVGGLRRPVFSAVVGIAGAVVLAFIFLKVAYISMPLGEGPFRAVSLALMRAMGVT